VRISSIVITLLALLLGSGCDSRRVREISPVAVEMDWQRPDFSTLRSAIELCNRALLDNWAHIDLCAARRHEVQVAVDATGLCSSSNAELVVCKKLVRDTSDQLENLMASANLVQSNFKKSMRIRAYTWIDNEWLLAHWAWRDRQQVIRNDLAGTLSAVLVFSFLTSAITFFGINVWQYRARLEMLAAKSLLRAKKNSEVSDLWTENQHERRWLVVLHRRIADHGIGHFEFDPAQYFESEPHSSSAPESTPAKMTLSRLGEAIGGRTVNSAKSSDSSESPPMAISIWEGSSGQHERDKKPVQMEVTHRPTGIRLVITSIVDSRNEGWRFEAYLGDIARRLPFPRPPTLSSKKGEADWLLHLSFAEIPWSRSDTAITAGRAFLLRAMSAKEILSSDGAAVPDCWIPYPYMVSRCLDRPRESDAHLDLSGRPSHS